MTVIDPLRTLAVWFNLSPMKTRASHKSWWRPLPAWLKGATLLFALPAWLFIVYCVVSGQAKSLAAFVAFAIFMAVTILHLIFDPRNRWGEHERSGFDVSEGGE